MNTERRHPSFGNAPRAEIVELKKNAGVSKMEAANLISEKATFFRLHGRNGSGQAIHVEQFRAEAWEVPLKRLGTSVDRGFGFSS